MKKRLFYNTVFSFLLQIVTVVCGFITPRLFLSAYGSEVNGLVHSVAQFLGIITLLELGVGQVIQSALYKPLANKDTYTMSCVLASGNRFFRRIAYILLAYVAVLTVIYPLVVRDDFDRVFTSTLIVAISIGSFAQYYFGIIDNILLNADQRGYIQYFSQIVALIVNTVLCVVFILAGFPVQVVKLSASVVFLIRPLAVRLYIRKHYDINRKVVYEGEPIRQKWNGIAQHISAFILAGTDNIVLTVFSTLSNVSIYSVYHMVVFGVHQLFQSASAGVHSLVGDLWAKKELDRLKRVYGTVEVLFHFATVFLFSCTGILILPFIRVYTDGITDADYIQPLFAVLIVLAHATQCIKTTYNIMILAGGHYKQTQKCQIISAALNIVISVSTVYFFGLIGVAVGTVIAMGYQMVWMAYYNSKHLLKWPFRNFLRQIFADVLTVLAICAATSVVELGDISYLGWFIMAVKVALIALTVTLAMAFIFHSKKMISLCSYLVNRRR